MNIRHQWTTQIATPVPSDLIDIMNEFVRDSQSATGVTEFMGKKLFYQFACRDGTESYVTLR